MGNFIQITCPLCLKSTHPTERNFTQNFNQIAEYRVVKSLGGQDGFKVLSSEKILDVIDQDPDAKESFETIRKSAIGLYNRLFELEFIERQDLPLPVQKKLESQEKKEDYSEQEIQDHKNRIRKLKKENQQLKEVLSEANNQIEKLKSENRKLKDYLDMR